jgi:hypothetical protein
VWSYGSRRPAQTHIWQRLRPAPAEYLRASGATTSDVGRRDASRFIARRRRAASRSRARLISDPNSPRVLRPRAPSSIRSFPNDFRLPRGPPQARKSKSQRIRQDMKARSRSGMAASNRRRSTSRILRPRSLLIYPAKYQNNCRPKGARHRLALQLPTLRTPSLPSKGRSLPPTPMRAETEWFSFRHRGPRRRPRRRSAPRSRNIPCLPAISPEVIKDFSGDPEHAAAARAAPR